MRNSFLYSAFFHRLQCAWPWWANHHGCSRHTQGNSVCVHGHTVLMHWPRAHVQTRVSHALRHGALECVQCQQPSQYCADSSRGTTHRFCSCAKYVVTRSILPYHSAAMTVVWRDTAVLMSVHCLPHQSNAAYVGCPLYDLLYVLNHASQNWHKAS